MKELNQEQHVQLLQFMTLMQNCKTEEEIKKLQEQYYNIPQYSFLQAYIPDRNENQSFSSYKTSLIYDMDKYQQDYFVYGEKAPAYRKKTMPNNKADYTVLNLLDEINECDNIKKYQELLKEKNNFPKAMIKSLSHEFTGIYFADGSSITQEITTISLSIPQIIIKNTPEDNFNARKQLVEAGYSLFNIPSVEDVQENGFDWLHEEITHFKALLNPNFIEQEKQIDQKPELKENEYEEEYDAFIEQMDANGGMSSMAAEADYNAFYEEQEEVLNPLISQENLNNYDKRLISICQVPQMPYLEKNITTGEWQPTKEAVEAVKNGTLFVEKQGQKYIMNESIDDKAEMKDLSETVDNESVNTDFSNNNIPEEYNETEQQTETHKQNFENNNSNVSAPRPRNIQELHNFFINNPYTSGSLVPTIGIRNEQTGHLTFIEGYDFARFEDVGKPNPVFRDENGKQIKPDGQTVVLSKPSLKEVLNEKTGKKELVPDENNRLFVRISRDIYERALKNSEIIAKRNPKTEQEKQKMIDDYLEAANLDEKRQRANTASNFWHNYQAGVMTLANNKQEAMAFAKRLVNEMIPAEREKFANMVRKYENIKGADGKHLSYDQRILDTYEEITKGLTITNKSIWRDHVNDKYNTLDAIKQNTEVFDKEGQSLDKTCRMKIGDTIKMSVTVDSALSNKKIKLPPQEYRLVAHSKDNNSVALISADGKQKIIKNREDFIKEVQKIEKKQLKKQQKQDRYESISM